MRIENGTSSELRHEAVSDELSDVTEERDACIPAEYDLTDGYSAEVGLNYCPHCGLEFSVNAHVGTVIDSDGRRFDSIYDTDPTQGPWFCPDCWDELETNRRSQQNHSLATFD